MKRLLVLALITSTLLVFAGCEEGDFATTVTADSVNEMSQQDTSLNWLQLDDITRIKTNIYGKEQAVTEANQTKLIQAQPAPMIDWSTERDNLIKRTQRFNDKNKISYIYTMTNNGQVVGFFDVRGKVSSVNSTLTSSTMAIGIDTHYTSPLVTVESPQLDGSYGNNGDAIFWFDSNDVYHEWNGTYFLSDQPVKLTVQPIMVEQQK